MKTSFLFLAPGFEEIEALTVVDVLRRGGMDIKTVSILPARNVTGAHGIEVVADMTMADARVAADAEWLIVPGGMPGSVNLAECDALGEMLKRHYDAGGKIAAICAAPAVVLAPLGILDGREATCYPGFGDKCPDAVMLDDRPVVALDTLITANGPSSALKFALAILANSMGADIAGDVGAGMLYYPAGEQFYF